MTQMAFTLSRFLSENMVQMRLRTLELATAGFFKALGSAAVTFNFRHNYLRHWVSVAVALMAELSLKVDSHGPLSDKAIYASSAPEPSPSGDLPA